MVTDRMMMVLELFHHRIARQIVGMTEIKGDGWQWELDSVDTALEVTGIWPIRGYFRRWKATIAEYVAGIPIYELCTGT